jgi:GDP-D-mannose 3',5'-epimerase
MKKALVLGAGGFIGGHLVTCLKNEGYWVRGVDIKEHEYKKTDADEFFILDLRVPANVSTSFTLHGVDDTFDEVYQLAADMGGAGYIFTGDHDANVMHNSAMINLNVANQAIKYTKMPKIFYSSSACMYPEYNQLDPDNPKCSEDSAYPAAPDSEYGWEKLFSERLPVRIGRFHNIFGPYGSWNNGKEKAPAAICRKVAFSEDGTVEIWGDGKQTRSFLYIDDCLETVRRFMESNFNGPMNIGSEEMISINGLAELAMELANKKLSIKNIAGPQGVRGRNSDNKLMRDKLGWEPSQPLSVGLRKTYEWIAGFKS